jgi:carbonic anhydrase
MSIVVRRNLSFRAAVAAALALALAGPSSASWAAEVEPAANLCESGKSQSPIDISTAAARPSSLRNPELRYRPAGVLLWNTGHSLQVEYAASAGGAGADNLMMLDGTAYQLVQFHFHLPGEHPVDGVAPAMELHLVHADARGNLAVVGVPMEVGPEDNPAFGRLLANVPPVPCGRAVLPTLFDAGSLLPPMPAITYRYAGSLTTPPYTEGLRWSVFDRPLSISQAQLDRYRELFPKPYARSPQPLNGRVPLKTTP